MAADDAVIPLGDGFDDESDFDSIMFGSEIAASDGAIDEMQPEFSEEHYEFMSDQIIFLD